MLLLLLSLFRRRCFYWYRLLLCWWWSWKEGDPSAATAAANRGGSGSGSGDDSRRGDDVAVAGSGDGVVAWLISAIFRKKRQPGSSPCVAEYVTNISSLLRNDFTTDTPHATIASRALLSLATACISG